MKRILALLLTPFAIQIEHTAPPRTEAVPCVQTEPMPIAGLHERPTDPMPVHRPDSAWRSAMPMHVTVPCYLVDSLRVDSLRVAPWR